MNDSYRLDKKDLKIIEAISDNARLPYSRIGKTTRISKDRVRERLFNLNKELFILSYFPLIDYTKLGYRLFHVFVRFKNVSLSNKFYKKICSCKYLIAFTRLAGKCDYELQLLAQNKEKIKKILKNLGINRRNFQYVYILSSSNLYHYTMHIYSKAIYNSIEHNEAILKNRINSLDRNILKSLSSDARKNIVTIASEIRASKEVVRYRINSLIKRRIIMGFYARTNKHRFRLQSYILLLKLDNIKEKNCKSLTEKENIYYIKRCKGSWNLIINFHALNNSQLIKTLDYIRNIFGKTLTQFELFILLERYIFNPFPKVLS